MADELLVEFRAVEKFLILIFRRQIDTIILADVPYLSYIPLHPSSIAPPLYERGWAYIERGLRGDEDDYYTTMFVHRCLHDTLVDCQLKYFVIIFRLFDAADGHHLVLQCFECQ